MGWLHHLKYQHVQDDEDTLPVEEESVSRENSMGLRLSNAFRGISTSKRFALGGLLLLIFYLFGGASHTAKHIQQQERVARYLHLLIPANKRDTNLCKTIVSSAVLDYPVPTLTNWGIDFDSSSPDHGRSSQLAGLNATLQYLTMLSSERDEDLVLIVDGYDALFQLRPGVLIERYFDIVYRGNAHIKSRFGMRAVEMEDISQRIVFSAQKSCQSGEGDDSTCFAVPESTLSDDSEKGMGIGNEGYRYLDSRMSMGDVSAMRKLFERALEKMDTDPNIRSDQSIFTQIFREQEIHREVIKERYLSVGQRIWRTLTMTSGTREATHPPMEYTKTTSYEFGIGLDFSSLLSHSPTSPSHTSWLRYNDTKSLATAQKSRNITSSSQDLRLPTDIQRSRLPFWSSNALKENLPQDLNWHNIPLYTHLQTGVIPSLIHPTSPDSQPLSAAWENMWFHPHTRALLTAHINSPYRAFAILRQQSENGEKETTYWSMHHEKWGTRTSNPGKEWIGWEELCGGEKEGYEEVLFRDGRGRWGPPRTDY